MFQMWSIGAGDCDHIKSHRVFIGAVATREYLRRSPYLFLLGSVHCFFRRSCGGSETPLDLEENYCAFIHRNQIDLGTCGAEVALYDPKAMALQMLLRELFALFSSRDP